MGILTRTGLGEPLLFWFNLFIFNRKQFRIHGVISSPITVSSGMYTYPPYTSPSLLMVLTCYYMIRSFGICWWHVNISTYSFNKWLSSLPVWLKQTCVLTPGLILWIYYSITITRSKNLFKSLYFINNTSISSLKGFVRDLEFIFTPILSIHIENICCKAHKSLCVLRNLNFQHPYIILCISKGYS